MKKFNKENINTPEYWDTHQTALDFGLRQQVYSDLVHTGKRIVELGCGLSPFLDHMKNRFHKRIGVDFSLETVREARKLYRNVKYIVGNVTDRRFPENFFNAVVAGEVIEHLEDPDLLVSEMERICKSGGIVVISTPKLEFDDPEHLWEFDEKWFWERKFWTTVIESDRFKGRSYIFAWKIV